MTSTTIKRIALFGSTGSIGKQALEVIAAHPDRGHHESGGPERPIFDF